MSAGNQCVVDCDTTKPLGPHIRPILHTRTTAGDRLLVEMWEATKTVAWNFFTDPTSGRAVHA